MKKPAYPIMAQLMAKHGVSRNDISETIGVSYRNTLKKINGNTIFDIVEAGKIAKVFKDLGEDTSIEDIFFSMR
jgi:DNA-binding XRE family transcriptional regulator